MGTKQRATAAPVGIGEKLSVSPARVQRIKTWHVERATDPRQDVALLHVSISADGQVVTAGVGLEPEHARAVLDALYDTAAHLERSLSAPRGQCTVHKLSPPPPRFQ